MAALFASIWLSRGLERGLEVGTQRLGADIVVLPGQIEAKPEQVLYTGLPLNIYMNKARYEDILKIEGVKQATPQFFTRTAEAMCCGLVSAGRVVGLDSATDFVVKPWMRSGVDRHLSSHDIIVGANIDVTAGNPVLVRGELFEVLEKLEPTGTGIDDSAFINMQTARRLAKESPDLKHLWLDKKPEQLVSAILVRVEGPGDLLSVAEAIDRLPGINAITTSQVVQDTRQRMGMVTTLLYALTGVLWLVSLMSLIGRFASAVVERKTEIGVLRALGAGQLNVFSLILLEAGCLALLSSLLGLGAGWLTSNYVVGWITSGTTLPFLSLPFIEAAQLSLWCLLAAAATVLISAMLPAYRATSLDPARAIALGELE